MDFFKLTTPDTVSTIKLDTKLIIPEIKTELVNDNNYQKPIDYSQIQHCEVKQVGKRDDNFNKFSNRLSPNNILKEL